MIASGVCTMLLQVGSAKLAAPPAHSATPLMRQSAGWAAWPDDVVTKPTETDPRGWMVASQPSLAVGRDRGR
jgi:hypothetical protein